MKGHGTPAGHLGMGSQPCRMPVLQSTWHLKPSPTIGRGGSRSLGKARASPEPHGQPCPGHRSQKPTQCSFPSPCFCEFQLNMIRNGAKVCGTKGTGRRTINCKPQCSLEVSKLGGCTAVQWASKHRAKTSFTQPILREL